MVVIKMQKNLIHSLFKPKLNVNNKEKEILKKCGFNDKRFEHMVFFECSKSKNESCCNSKCQYNLVSAHSSDVYIRISNSGVMDAKTSN